MPWSWVNTECSTHEVQHTLSTAYTEYNIHRVQHTPSTAFTEDYLLSLHSLEFELTAECRFSFRRTSLPIDRHQPVLHKSVKGKVTSSHSHCFELTNRWRESQHLARLPSTASRSTTSKYSSNLALSYPATSASPNSLDHGLGVYLWVHSILLSNCISKVARSWPQSASLCSLDLGLQLHLHTRSITASQCISEFPQCRSPIASPNSLDDGLQVHLWVHSISVSKCISNSLDHGLPAHLCVHFIPASKCISKLARSRPRSVCLTSIARHLQAHLELLTITACCQSRYTVCR